MKDCLFCKIIAGEIPSTKVYEDENVFAFNDISPLAPVHVLIVPKQHIENIDGLNGSNADIMGKLFLAAKEIAKQKGVAGGYRIVTNTGARGGQEIFHLHLHLLGGRETMGPVLT